MTIESPMALAWGRGERLLPAPRARPRARSLLVVPDFGVSTADAYGWLSPTAGRTRRRAAVLAPESLATWEAIVAVATNDFERVVARRHPVDRRAGGRAQASMSARARDDERVGIDRVRRASTRSSPACGGRGSAVDVIATRTSDRVQPVEVGT